jgi:glycerol-3-phosphate acyltransferase PlsY
VSIGSPWAETLAALLAYSIGGIPFGWLLVRVVKGVDLRRVGSGGTGATNASRLWLGNASVGIFVLVFFLDFAKGFCAAYFAHALAGWLEAAAPGETVGLLCGAAAILGHVFSPYLRFKGGKGVATALGAVTALAPWSALAALAVWAVVLLLTRYMSLGSIGAMLALPISYLVFRGEQAFGARAGIFFFLLGLAAVVIWRHRGNVVRILQGQERKVGAVDQQL